MEFSETYLAALVENFFVIHPARKGVNKAAASKTIICVRWMEKCEPTSKCTIGGRTNGTANEVTIINPTINVKLLPIKFATNGAPSPVEIPDNNRTDNPNDG